MERRKKIKYSIFKTMLFNRKRFKEQKLFFTDEYGKFISAENFKNFFLCLFFATLIILPITVISLSLLYSNVFKYTDLKKELKISKKKIEKLEHQLTLFKVNSFIKIEKKERKSKNISRLKINNFAIYEEKELFKLTFSIKSNNKKEPLMCKIFIVLQPKDDKDKKIIFPFSEVNKDEIVDHSKGQYIATDNSKNSFQFKIDRQNTPLSKFKECTIHIYSMENLFLKKKSFRKIFE